MRGNTITACCLEAGAEIFAKPELMIHADDVQCAHPATPRVALDQTALFYMRSRGITEAQARALLIEAFLIETIPEGLPCGPDGGIGGTHACLARGERDMNAPLIKRPFDVEAVRAQFPILERSVHGRPLVYLDNAASAQEAGRGD